MLSIAVHRDKTAQMMHVDSCRYSSSFLDDVTHDGVFFFFSKSGETQKQNPGTLEKSNMADLVGKTAGDCGIVVGLIQSKKKIAGQTLTKRNALMAAQTLSGERVKV